MEKEKGVSKFTLDTTGFSSSNLRCRIFCDNGCGKSASDDEIWQLVMRLGQELNPQNRDCVLEELSRERFSFLAGTEVALNGESSITILFSDMKPLNRSKIFLYALPGISEDLLERVVARAINAL